VHGDICGPAAPTTLSGSRYFLLLVDDMSRFMWLCLLASKDQVSAVIRRFKMAAEVESGRKLKLLHTDRGGKFTSLEFGAYCTEEGVQRQLTAPYSPQQNDVVEWRNQTVVGMKRNMLLAKGLPGMFWGEAVTTAMFILNSSPTQPQWEDTI
jgi:transposase InsO family protein